METETTTDNNTDSGEGVGDGVGDGEGDDSLNMDQLADLVDNDPDEEDDEAIGNFFVESKPLQGYHMTASFTKRLWLTVQHLHSGLIIYKCIFATALFALKKYTFLADLDTKCLAYLLHTTSDCGQRSAFVYLLAQLCFIFPTYEDIAAGQDIIKKLVLSTTNNEFMENLQSQSGQAYERKKNTILTVFESINKLGTTRAFMVNKNHFKKGNVVQNQYNVVVGTVFFHHLKFAAQRELRVDVFKLHRKLIDKAISKKPATSITTITSGTKRKQSCVDATTSSYVGLSSQLTTCAIDTDDQVCNTCINPTVQV